MEEEKSRPKFVSEYSMGQFDFERYNKWLEWIERWSAEINSTMNPTLDMIQHYFSGLNVLWKNWKAIISSKEFRTNMEKKIKEAKEKKRIWERHIRNKTPFSVIKINELVDGLDYIHTELMDIKQIIGLGIMVKRNMNIREKIRSGMGRNNQKFLSLPEK